MEGDDGAVGKGKSEVKTSKIKGRERGAGRGGWIRDLGMRPMSTPAVWPRGRQRKRRITGKVENGRQRRDHGDEVL